MAQVGIRKGIGVVVEAITNDNSNHHVTIEAEAEHATHKVGGNRNHLDGMIPKPHRVRCPCWLDFSSRLMIVATFVKERVLSWVRLCSTLPVAALSGATAGGGSGSDLPVTLDSYKRLWPKSARQAAIALGVRIFLKIA